MSRVDSSSAPGGAFTDSNEIARIVHEPEVIDEFSVEKYISESPTGVEFSEDTPEEVWSAYMQFLAKTEQSIMFRLGDSLLFGERKYRQYEQALEDTGRAYQTLVNAKNICNRVESNRRRLTLTFSHHAEVAKLPPEEQDYWLDQAEPLEGMKEPRLSSRELRQAIREAAKLRRLDAIEVEEPERVEVEVSAGEWWRLGEHVLFCGDSTSEEFKDGLPDAALAFADPPYNAGVADWDYGFLWDHDYLIDVAEIVTVTPGIVSVFDFARVTRMPYKWSLAGFISNGMTRGAVGYGNWVYAAVFSRESIYRQAQDAIRFSIKTSETSETDHKGRKPQELMAYIVDTFTERGDTVIDPFLGSGSTLIACESLSRKCVGAELDPDYCSRIVARWQKKTGERAERIAGGKDSRRHA